MRPLMLNTQAPFPSAALESPTAAATVPDTYRIKPIFAPPDDHGYRPAALNDRGEMIGNLVRPPRFEEGSWIASGVHHPVANEATLGGHQAQNAWPYAALSSNGYIAGTHGTPAQNRRAWASHLGDFGELYWPGSVSLAQGVNAEGIVVGKTLLPVEPLLISRGFMIAPGGRPSFFNAPEGGLTDAVAINDAGTVLLNVSSLAPGNPVHRAWLWRDKTWEPLETPAHCSAFGHTLTPDGTVVGLVRTEGDIECAALWRDGRLVDLGIPFALKFRPAAARDAQLIVGTARRPDGRECAARWTPHRGVQFLDDLLVPGQALHLSSALGTNSAGAIIVASDHGAHSTGFLLTPPD